MKIKKFIFFILVICMPIMAHAACKDATDKDNCSGICKWDEDTSTCIIKCETNINPTTDESTGEATASFLYNPDTDFLNQTNDNCLTDSFTYSCKEGTNNKGKPTGVFKWSADVLPVSLLKTTCYYTTPSDNYFWKKYTFNKCENGKKLNSDKTECQQCTAGKACDGNEEHNCTDGYYCESGVQKVCPKGKYSKAQKGKITQCTVCAAGTYTETEGQSECSNCEAGYFCLGENQPDSADTRAWNTWAAYRSSKGSTFSGFTPGIRYLCPRGWYQSGKSVVAGGKQNYCDQCGPGQNTRTEGSTSETDCFTQANLIGFAIPIKEGHKNTIKHWFWPSYMKVSSTNWKARKDDIQTEENTVGVKDTLKEKSAFSLEKN